MTLLGRGLGTALQADGGISACARQEEGRESLSTRPCYPVYGAAVNLATGQAFARRTNVLRAQSGMFARSWRSDL
jgi:hypothetical protein